jgi:hypothetical protein
MVVGYLCGLGLLVTSLLTGDVFSLGALAALVFWLFWAYLVHRHTMNVLQYVGPVYWVLRNSATGRGVRWGFARQTDPPYYRGKGIEARWQPFSLQIGLGRKHPTSGEDGLLESIDGRHLDASPETIGTWPGGTQREHLEEDQDG